MSKQTDPAIAWLSSLVAPMAPKDYLLEQACKLLIESGQAKPPFDPKKAIPPSVKQVEIVKLSRDGLLIPVEGGFILKLNSQKPLVRQNFACAHEIGHTFFYDLSGTRPWRPYESMSSYWAEEELCYQFAEEMLMPRSEITGIGGGLLPCIMSFQQLLGIFQVSIEALARRIARLNLWHCILIVMVANDRKPIFLRRKVIYKHRDYRYFSLNWDELFPLMSNSYEAVKSPGKLKKDTINAPNLFRRGKKDGHWFVESLGFSGLTTKTAVSIIVPE